VHRVGYIYEVKWDAFTDPPSGHTTETSVGTNGSRVIGVELSFRPGGGFEGTGFDPRCSRTPLPLLRRSKNPPGFFVATNLLRELGGELFAFFPLLQMDGGDPSVMEVGGRWLPDGGSAIRSHHISSQRGQ